MLESLLSAAGRARARRGPLGRQRVGLLLREGRGRRERASREVPGLAAESPRVRGACRVGLGAAPLPDGGRLRVQGGGRDPCGPDPRGVQRSGCRGLVPRRRRDADSGARPTPTPPPCARARRASARASSCSSRCSPRSRPARSRRPCPSWTSWRATGRSIPRTAGRRSGTSPAASRFTGETADGLRAGEPAPTRARRPRACART